MNIGIQVALVAGDRDPSGAFKGLDVGSPGADDSGKVLQSRAAVDGNVLSPCPLQAVPDRRGPPARR